MRTVLFEDVAVPDHTESFTLAVSMRASTSYLERFKFSIEKALMVTILTPDL